MVKESGISLSGASLGILLHYFLLMVLTRFLPPRDYGTFALGQSVIHVILIFALAGTPSILERFIAFFNASMEQGKTKTIVFTIFPIVFAFSFICSVVTYISSSFIAHSIFLNDQLYEVLKLMAFSIPTLAFLQLVSSTFIGFKELRYHSIIQYVTLPILMIILAAITFIAGWGLAAWTRMYVLSLFGTSLLGLWFLRTRIRPVLSKISGNPVPLHEMVSYAWPMSITGLIVLFLAQVNTLLLGYFQSVEEVGIYRIYWSLALIMTVIQDSLGRIYKPTVSVHAAKQDFAAIREIYKRTAKWSILINVFVAGLFAILGRLIIALFFAPEYTIYFTAFLIMIGGQLTNSVFGFQARTLEALRSVRLLLLNNAIRLVLNVGLALLIIPLFGIYGAAITAAFTTMTLNVISYLEIRILYKIKLFDRDYLRTLAGVLSITGAAFLAKSLLDLSRNQAWQVALACAFILAQILFIFKYATDVNDKQILHAIWFRVRGLQKRL